MTCWLCMAPALFLSPLPHFPENEDVFCFHSLTQERRQVPGKKTQSNFSNFIVSGAGHSSNKHTPMEETGKDKN